MRAGACHARSLLHHGRRYPMIGHGCFTWPRETAPAALLQMYEAATIYSQQLSPMLVALQHSPASLLSPPAERASHGCFDLSSNMPRPVAAGLRGCARCQCPTAAALWRGPTPAPPHPPAPPWVMPKPYAQQHMLNSNAGVHETLLESSVAEQPVLSIPVIYGVSCLLERQHVQKGKVLTAAYSLACSKEDKSATVHALRIVERHPCSHCTLSQVALAGR